MFVAEEDDIARRAEEMTQAALKAEETSTAEATKAPDERQDALEQRAQELEKAALAKVRHAPSQRSIAKLIIQMSGSHLCVINVYRRPKRQLQRGPPRLWPRGSKRQRRPQGDNTNKLLRKQANEALMSLYRHRPMCVAVLL